MVLSDDAFRQILRKFDRKKNPTRPSANRTESNPEVDMESTSGESDTEPPPAPTPPAPSRDKPTGSRSKSHKRGASSVLSGPSAKK